jgi:hypothetical protein
MTANDARDLSGEGPAPPGPLDGSTPLAGHLHLFVAFDWGDEIDLEHARRLAPGSALELSRRPRTPASIAYRPPPLRFGLGSVALPLPALGSVPVRAADATVFDFAAVSVALQLPLRLTMDGWRQLAEGLADPGTATGLIRVARQVATPLFEQVRPAIQKPFWHPLWEEYAVFQFPPGSPLTPPRLLGEQKGWLAALLRLEGQPLSGHEVAEAIRLYLEYGPHDLFVADWAAAVLLDHEPECSETLRTIEFANLQLLEYRHIDDRLDHDVTRAQRLIHEAVRSLLPFWRSHGAPLRVVGELKVEANGLFERTGNVLKLVGDQYLARVYRLLATRFHLGQWERSIQRKLEVIEGVYQVIADQTAAFRTEFLELIVIFLILLEILLAIFRH